ncbi:Hypothetical predicted protein [Cloeon dipterum]|uniref:Uncharacterized protein n=1 Tax=Cloeon dipterum TaxID=197152 RepID=A0A8S1DZZ1_9INSE|nr:Hypothetical predicted protein [Cloeon dipterum]
MVNFKKAASNLKEIFKINPLPPSPLSGDFALDAGSEKQTTLFCLAALTSEKSNFGDKIFKRYYEDDWEEHPDRMVPVDEIKDSQEDSRFNCIRFVDGGSSFDQNMSLSIDQHHFPSFSRWHQIWKKLESKEQLRNY